MCVIHFVEWSVLLSIIATTVIAGGAQCEALHDLGFLSASDMAELGYDLPSSGYYFCADNAPLQFRCSCSSTTVCAEKMDPFHRDVGQCVCCPGWLYALLVLFIVLVATSFVLCGYVCFCKSKWWCDGYPEAIVPVLPRRSQPVVAPQSVPLPANLFRGFHSTSFADDPRQITTTANIPQTLTGGFPIQAFGSDNNREGGGNATNPVASSSERREER